MLQAGRAQVLRVGRDDPAPLRVQVDARDRAEDHRAQRGGLREELDLGGPQLGSRIGDEHQHVRHGEGAQRDAGVRGGEPAADAGRVHQHQPAGQQLAREPDLEGARRRPRVPRGDRVELRRGDRGPAGRSGALLVEHVRLEPVAVAHVGRDRRGDVRVGGAHPGAQQRVDQRALALLELAADDDPAGRVREPRLRHLDPRAAGRGGRAAGQPGRSQQARAPRRPPCPHCPCPADLPGSPTATR